MIKIIFIFLTVVCILIYCNNPNMSLPSTTTKAGSTNMTSETASIYRKDHRRSIQDDIKQAVSKNI